MCTKTSTQSKWFKELRGIPAWEFCSQVISKALAVTGVERWATLKGLLFWWLTRQQKGWSRQTTQRSRSHHRWWMRHFHLVPLSGCPSILSSPVLYISPTLSKLYCRKTHYIIAFPMLRFRSQANSHFCHGETIMMDSLRMQIYSVWCFRCIMIRNWKIMKLIF